jgi:hypothetical protein
VSHGVAHSKQTPAAEGNISPTPPPLSPLPLKDSVHTPGTVSLTILITRPQEFEGGRTVRNRIGVSVKIPRNARIFSDSWLLRKALLALFRPIPDCGDPAREEEVAMHFEAGDAFHCPFPLQQKLLCSDACTQLLDDVLTDD